MGCPAMRHVVSDDGSSIWLTSFLELLPSDTDDGMGDVYRFDVASSTVTLLTGGLDNVWHFEVTDASTDGTILALHAISGTLGAQGVFRLDTVSGDARRVDLMLPWAPDVSKQAVGPTMSGDGRRLAYLADPADRVSAVPPRLCLGSGDLHDPIGRYHRVGCAGYSLRVRGRDR